MSNPQFPSFLLRPFREGDQLALLKHANNSRIAANVRDTFPHPYTLADANWFVRTGSQGANQLSFAIEIGGEAVGAIGCVHQTDIHRASAEIGYWLGETYWGRGIMTEAARRVVPLAFAHWPEVQRIFAGILSHNPASMRVLEKAGFSPEAVLRRAVMKNGVVEDEHLYAVWRE